MIHNIFENVLNKSLLGSFAKFSSMFKYMRDQSLHSTQYGNCIVPESLISKVKNQL